MWQRPQELAKLAPVEEVDDHHYLLAGWEKKLGKRIRPESKCVEFSANVTCLRGPGFKMGFDPLPFSDLLSIEILPTAWGTGVNDEGAEVGVGNDGEVEDEGA